MCTGIGVSPSASAPPGAWLTLDREPYHNSSPSYRPKPVGNRRSGSSLVAASDSRPPTEQRQVFDYADKRGTPYEFLLGHLGREILIARGWLKGAY